jgi:glucan phosphoethanolaminetransferase (alkaline phosphatase superfamily)
VQPKEKKKMDEKYSNPQKMRESLYSVNYIYYGLYFLFFVALQIGHVFLITPSDLEMRGWYTASALFASFIEVCSMTLISACLVHYKKKALNRLFLVFTGLLMLCRIIDFLLVRLMDISIWHGLEFIMQETFANFIEMLYASSITLSVWALGLFIGLLSLGFALGLFYLGEKICSKKPLFCSAKSLLGVIILGLSCLAFSNIGMHFIQSPLEQQREYAKALPWKMSLLPQEETVVTMASYLKSVPKESSFLREADSNVFSLERKPDLFLFVVESLRQDFLTQDVTPTLAQFRQENTQFSQTLSVSNATQTSWFSIFYSLYPFYWTQYQAKDYKMGSPSLALLKKMGYKIHVYSASRLNFYSMKRILFGENGHLADSLQEFQTDAHIPPCEADRNLINKLTQDIESSDEVGGRVFITFLDSTHFDYSWPQDKPPVFAPIEDNFNYIKLSCFRDNLEKVKNRYRNSLHYVDGLFSHFRLSLEQKGLWDDSVVVFTADHGEEFNEYGHMFHASTLSIPQLEVPLYIKLQKGESSLALNANHKASQIDIFPTFFHYVIGEDAAAELFQGKSLFSSKAKSYVAGARYNASLTPYQFYVQGGPYRMTLEFADRRDVLHCNNIKIHSIEDEKGEKVPFVLSLVTTYFKEAFDALFGPSGM